MSSRNRAEICNACGEAFLAGCVVTNLCPQCATVARCKDCEGTGEGECPSGQCDGRWHSCHFCDIKPKNYIDCLASDEAFDQFLAAHPLNKREAVQAELAVKRIREKLGRHRP